MNKLVDTFKVAPYGESLIAIGIIGIFFGNNFIIANSIILSGIGYLETSRSFNLKNQLIEILEKEGYKKHIFNIYKRHFCNRQATLAALKEFGNKNYENNFKKTLEEYKKNPSDILKGFYID